MQAPDGDFMKETSGTDEPSAKSSHTDDARTQVNNKVALNRPFDFYSAVPLLGEERVHAAFLIHI